MHIPERALNFHNVLFRPGSELAIGCCVSGCVDKSFCRCLANVFDVCIK